MTGSRRERPDAAGARPGRGRPGAAQVGEGQPGAARAGEGQPGAAQAGKGQPGARAPGVPLSIWDIPERGARGPKPKYGRAQIAATAARLADAEGLDAVTMRRMAAELGLGTMSLYNYVPAKDHLIQLMIDHVAGEYSYPSLPAPDHRAAIVDLARQGRRIARRHPWLARVMHRPQPIGPSALRYMDCFLGLLEGSGLDAGVKLQILAMVNGFAVMYGGMEAAVAEEQARTGISGEELAAAQTGAMIKAATSGRYPHLAAALTNAAPPRDAEDIFESSVLRLIAGALDS